MFATSVPTNEEHSETTVHPVFIGPVAGIHLNHGRSPSNQLKRIHP